ncbi:SDR family oxidoreductase [Bradyrhizobium sp. USDA 4529]
MGLVRVAALEGAEHGLTVNAVAPGWMEIGLMQGHLQAIAAERDMSIDQVVAAMRAQQPGDRFVDVGEVAATVGFLASPSASAINGVCIPLDIGASA